MLSVWRGISLQTTLKKPSCSLNSRARPRSRPSTSTFTFPSGSFRLWTMLQMVPRVWISSGPGLSRVASCWAERKIRFPFTSAYSRALMEEGRPMTNGIIMWGKTTTSRSGTMGRVSITSAFSLSRPNIGEGLLAFHSDTPLRARGAVAPWISCEHCASWPSQCSSASSRTPLCADAPARRKSKAAIAVRRGRSGRGRGRARGRPSRPSRSR